MEAKWCRQPVQPWAAVLGVFFGSCLSFNDLLTWCELDICKLINYILKIPQGTLLLSRNNQVFHILTRWHSSPKRTVCEAIKTVQEQTENVTEFSCSFIFSLKIWESAWTSLYTIRESLLNTIDQLAAEEPENFLKTCQRLKTEKRDAERDIWLMQLVCDGSVNKQLCKVYHAHRLWWYIITGEDLFNMSGGVYMMGFWSHLY